LSVCGFLGGAPTPPTPLRVNAVQWTQFGGPGGQSVSERLLLAPNKKTDSWQLTIDKLPTISENPSELVESDMMSGLLSWKEYQQG
jgi:hypothetical protein